MRLSIAIIFSWILIGLGGCAVAANPNRSVCQGPQRDGSYRVVMSIPTPKESPHGNGDQSVSSEGDTEKLLLVNTTPASIDIDGFRLDAGMTADLTGKPEHINIIRSKKFGEFLKLNKLSLQKYQNTNIWEVRVWKK